MIFSLFVVLAGTEGIKLDDSSDYLLLDSLRDHLIALLQVKRRLRPISLCFLGRKEHIHLDLLNWSTSNVASQDR